MAIYDASNTNKSKKSVRSFYKDLDLDLLDAAQSVADEVLSKHPQLAQQHLQRWLGEKSEYLRV